MTVKNKGSKVEILYFPYFYPQKGEGLAEAVLKTVKIVQVTKDK